MCIRDSTQFVRTLQGKQKQKRGVVIVAGHAPVVNWNGTDKNPIGPLVYEGARNDKYDMGAIAHNFDEFMAVAFAHHLKQIELILCGHTHEHVESIISPSHPKRGLGIRVEASGPDWGTKFFSDSLADASDKGAWWVQHGVLQIETPCLFPKKDKPFDMLRVAVEDGVISSIKGKLMPDQTPV